MFVIDESSYRIDKTAFHTAEEAERRAAEAARILNRAINVHELMAGELHFAFRVMPDGSVEERNPLADPEPGESVPAPSPVVLGRKAILDHVAESLEAAGQVSLAAVVDQEQHLLSQSREPKGLRAIARSLKNGE